MKVIAKYKSQKDNKKQSSSVETPKDNILDSINKQLISFRRKGDHGGSVARSPIKAIVDDLLMQDKDCKFISKHIKEKYGFDVGADSVNNYKRNYFLKDRAGFQKTVNDDMVADHLEITNALDPEAKTPLSVKETLKIMDLIKSRVYVLRKEIDDISKAVTFDFKGFNLQDQVIVAQIQKNVISIISGAFGRRMATEKLINNYVHSLTQLQEYIARFEVENTEKSLRGGIAQRISEIAMSFFIPLVAKTYTEQEVNDFIKQYSAKIKDFLDGKA